MKYFDALGDRILDEWSAAAFDSLRFPEIAAEALKASRPYDHVSVEDIVLWVASARSLPRQYLASTFGQPPIQLYWNSRFYIEALFWTSTDTAIHQHNFAGAFSVLEGMSIQTTYSFFEEQRVNAHMRLGRVVMDSAKLLRRGDVEPIFPGAALTHGVFHIGEPHVTIVVRTESEYSAYYQMRLTPPNIAEDPFFRDEVVTRQVQILSMLRRARRDLYDAMLIHVLRNADLHIALMVLRQARDHLREQNKWDAFLAKAQDIVGHDLALLEPGLRYEDRSARLEERRGHVNDPTVRFVLALSVSVPHRDAFLELLTEQYGSQSVRILAAAILTLSPPDTSSAQAGAWLADVVALLINGVGAERAIELVQGAAMDESQLRGTLVKKYAEKIAKSEMFGFLFPPSMSRAVGREPPSQPRLAGGVAGM